MNFHITEFIILQQMRVFSKYLSIRYCNCVFYRVEKKLVLTPLTPGLAIKTHLLLFIPETCFQRVDLFQKMAGSGAGCLVPESNPCRNQSDGKPL